ncbi:winged helix-turn-helix transcriptional regulator [Larkinella soli]|uniref:winged helix-turn-helix transcriptional regulator n=1 Tax=Larkinella soli TaxID=1770527 RepID=UPI000FFC40F3|nr:helix-turn-helix domain-containing protein [Larkinella soli]
MQKEESTSFTQPDYTLIRKALEIVSGKWRLYIILLVGEETWRYSQISDRMPAVSEKVLAGELKALVALGVMDRKVYAQIPPRVEYSLTAKGLQALPILEKLEKLGQLFI